MVTEGEIQEEHKADFRGTIFSRILYILTVLGRENPISTLSRNFSAAKIRTIRPSLRIPYARKF